MVDIRAKFVLV